MTAPAQAPLEVAPETWLLPNLLPAGTDAFVPVSSMLIRGAEPVVVDTGAAVHRDQWFEMLFALVEPDDVRWIFLSHEEVDHMGNLRELLDRCPRATLVSCFFLGERVAAEAPLPLHRQRWLEPGERLDVGDRVLHAVRPPVYDAPTTRGLLDTSTGTLWAVDAFASPVPGPVGPVGDVPAAMYEQGFREFNSLLAPWLELVDRDAFARHAETTRRLRPSVVLSAHGPILAGAAVDDAYDRLLALAGAPPAAPPGQPFLEELLATAGTEVTGVSEPVPV